MTGKEWKAVKFSNTFFKILRSEWDQENIAENHWSSFLLICMYIYSLYWWWCAMSCIVLHSSQIPHLLASPTLPGLVVGHAPLPAQSPWGAWGRIAGLERDLCCSCCCYGCFQVLDLHWMGPTPRRNTLTVVHPWAHGWPSGVPYNMWGSRQNSGWSPWWHPQRGMIGTCSTVAPLR